MRKALKILFVAFQTLLLTAVICFFAFAWLMWRAGLVDMSSLAGVVQQKQEDPAATVQSFNMDEFFETQARSGTLLSSLRLNDYVYTREQVDGRVGSLASVTTRDDPIFADDADWTIEMTSFLTPIDGIDWSSYSFLVRMEDGASTNGTVVVRSHGGEARYARQFNLVAASASARDGSDIANISGNSLVPTGAGSGTAVVDVTYGGRTKTVSVGVHPVYTSTVSETIQENQASAQGIESRRAARIRALEARAARAAATNSTEAVEAVK